MNILKQSNSNIKITSDVLLCFFSPLPLPMSITMSDAPKKGRQQDLQPIP